MYNKMISPLTRLTPPSGSSPAPAPVCRSHLHTSTLTCQPVTPPQSYPPVYSQSSDVFSKTLTICPVWIERSPESCYINTHDMGRISLHRRDVPLRYNRTAPAPDPRQRLPVSFEWEHPRSHRHALLAVGGWRGMTETMVAGTCWRSALALRVSGTECSGT